MFVMFSHLTLSFARYIVRPSNGPDKPVALMQLPILRLVVQGPAWVAIFFILSGFVNGLKPLQLVRAGDIEGALSNLSVSSFRRPFRLILPSLVATILGWTFAQLGAFELGRKSDAYWIRITSPEASPSWPTAFADLLKAFGSTWAYSPVNPYDQPQWAMVYLLQGSLMVFFLLLVTANLGARFRVLIYGLCCYWSMDLGRKLGDRKYAGHSLRIRLVPNAAAAMVGLNVFGGLLHAELFHSRYPAQCAPYSRIFAAPAVLLALVLMSFPADFQTMASWSSFLLDLFTRLPLDIPNMVERSRLWPSVGAQVLVGTIILSPDLRRVLSHPWLLWLGQISFPLYLLHGTIIRSLLSWLLFSGSEPVPVQDGQLTYLRYPIPGISTFVIAMPIFFLALFTASHVWTKKMEPLFGIMTHKVERLMFDKTERQPALPIRSD